MDQKVIRHTDIISSAIERLFIIGGLALVFVFLGFMAMIFGHFHESNLSPYIFGIGAFFNIAILCLSLYQEVQGRQKAKKLLRDNKELLDTTQDIAIDLTEIISKTQPLMYKHAEEIGKILELSVPLLSQLPILDGIDLSERLNVNAVIVSTTGKSKDIVDDVHKEALVTGKVKDLKKYSKNLKKTTESLREALSQVRITKSIPDYNKIIETLQKNLTVLTNTLITAQSVVINYVERVDTTLSIAASLLEGVEFLGIGRKLDELGISKLIEFSNQTKDQLSQCKALSDKLNEALIAKDIESTSKALDELKKFTERLNEHFHISESADK